MSASPTDIKTSNTERLDRLLARNTELLLYQYSVLQYTCTLVA